MVNLSNKSELKYDKHKEYYKRNKTKLLLKKKQKYKINKKDVLAKKAENSMYYIRNRNTILQKLNMKYKCLSDRKKRNYIYKNGIQSKYRYSNLTNAQKHILRIKRKYWYKTRNGNLSSNQKLLILLRKRKKERLRYANVVNSINGNPTEKKKMVYLYLSDKKKYMKSLMKYKNAILKGPTEVCVCCGGLWFSRQIKLLSPMTICEKFSIDFVNKVFYVNECSNLEKNKFCKSCAKYIEKGDVPVLCLWNGLDIPNTPDCLEDLSCLEERLCAPRIPFMQIKQLGYERQCGLKGQIVNVPINVNTNVNLLPRSIDDTYTIQLHIKRKMSYKTDYMCEVFRPNAVFRACAYLENTPAYRYYNIKFTKDYKIYNCDKNTKYQVFAIEKDDIAELSNSINNKNENTDMNYTIKNNCEETLLNTSNIESVTLAPGENKIPISILFDAHAEELSFPKVFCGMLRKFKIKLTYNQIVKSTIRNYKRKCSRVDLLFFMYKKSELLKLSSCVSICLRKKYLKNNNLTAEQMLNQDFVNNLIQHDDGYKLLQEFPSAPAYWLRKGKEIRAMIRQLGLPTFFITLSSAETKWGELLRILHKVNNNIDISIEEAKNLSFVEKAKLIREDPVTCSRYFDHRIRELLKLIKSKTGIFKDHPCTNYYWRIEVQQRGSLHLHGLFWLHKSPVILIIQ